MRLVPIDTPKGTFRVRTKRVGNNPRSKVLLLHGGPGATHEYCEAFDSYFPAAGIEYYHDDQLGSYDSDQPDEPGLWERDRFVDEAEQVRKGSVWTVTPWSSSATPGGHPRRRVRPDVPAAPQGTHHLQRDGQHPCLQPGCGDRADAGQRPGRAGGGEAARGGRRHRQPAQHGASHPAALREACTSDAVERDTRSRTTWRDEAPQPCHRRADAGTQRAGASGKLVAWDRTDDLDSITVPTLATGARHDTMDPKHMKMLADTVQRGRDPYCPNGSHLAMDDDQAVHMEGVTRFLRDVDGGAS